MPGKWGGACRVRPPRSANELGCQANGGARAGRAPQIRQCTVGDLPDSRRTPTSGQYLTSFPFPPTSGQYMMSRFTNKLLRISTRNDFDPVIFYHSSCRRAQIESFTSHVLKLTLCLSFTVR